LYIYVLFVSISTPCPSLQKSNNISHCILINYTFIMSYMQLCVYSVNLHNHTRTRRYTLRTSGLYAIKIKLAPFFNHNHIDINISCPLPHTRGRHVKYSSVMIFFCSASPRVYNMIKYIIGITCTRLDRECAAFYSAVCGGVATAVWRDCGGGC